MTTQLISVVDIILAEEESTTILHSTPKLEYDIKHNTSMIVSQCNMQCLHY